MDVGLAAPPSLIKYESPLHVGEGAAGTLGRSKSGSAKAADVHLEEILNSVLPPRYVAGFLRLSAASLRALPRFACITLSCCEMYRMWTQDDGVTFMQYVAKDAASRLDVVSLQEALDQRLMQRQAREMGICPVREDLYSQAFGTLGVCLCFEADGGALHNRHAHRRRIDSSSDH
jgi:hypothetical protein